MLHLIRASTVYRAAHPADYVLCCFLSATSWIHFLMFSFSNSRTNLQQQQHPEDIQYQNNSSYRVMEE